MSQASFFFDAPLTETPASQIPPKPVIPASIPTECEAFVQAALVVLETIADGFDVQDVLKAMGVPKLSIIGWHWSRVLEAIKRPTPGLPYDQGPYGPFQSYKQDGKTLYRRLPPIVLCPGWDGSECTETVRAGAHCPKCRELESAACLTDTYMVFSSEVYLSVGSLIPTDNCWVVIGTATSKDIPDTSDHPSKHYWYRAVPTD